MKISKKLLVNFQQKTLIPVFVIIVLVLIASNKYGYISVLKGLGIFSSLVIFIIVVIRIYQELNQFLKKRVWTLGSVLTTLMVGVIIGVPFLFINFLNNSYLILGTVLSTGVLGILLLYDLIRKILK